MPWADEAQLSLTKMITVYLLTNPPAKPYTIPGDKLAKAALGYLDTNCGSCHYEGSTYVTDKLPLHMNLSVDTLASVEMTNAYRTTINEEPHIDG